MLVISLRSCFSFLLSPIVLSLVLSRSISPSSVVIMSVSSATNTWWCLGIRRRDERTSIEDNQMALVFCGTYHDSCDLIVSICWMRFFLKSQRERAENHWAYNAKRPSIGVLQIGRPQTSKRSVDRITFVHIDTFLRHHRIKFHRWRSWREMLLHAIVELLQLPHAA